MKRPKTVSILVFLVMFLGIGVQGAFGASKVSVETPEFQAGEVPQGTVIVHSFTLKNTGNEPLTLKVKTCTCGGLKFETPEKPIAPSQTGVIKVSIPTRYYKGEYVKEILVETNDPDRKELKLTIRATVKEVLSIQPHTIVFPPSDKGSEQVKEIAVANKSNEPVTIMDIEVKPAETFVVSPSGKSILKPGHKQVFRVECRIGIGQEVIRGEVIFRSDKKQLPEIKVPVFVASAEKGVSMPK